MQHEIDLLLKEIEHLKSGMMKRYMKNNVDHFKTTELSRKSIEKKINAELNETDWTVLTSLVDKPTLSNSELAEIVFLSYDGVRSSLKRLYSLFDLSKSTEKSGILMKLIFAALTYSNSENPH